VPELPEVETARSLIADEALHRLIVGVDDADTFVCRPHSPGELRDALTGRTLTAAHRRGKTMWIETSGVGGSTQPGPDLGLHLGMGGRIVVTSKGGDAVEGGGPVRRDAQSRKTEWNRFTLHFADGGALVLFDKRRLGRVRLNPGIDALGPDAEEVTPAEFRSLITKGSIAVKARLLDQSKIAGVGNLLADEILWKAKVSPAARTGSLQRRDADRLYRALQSALQSAIAKGGVHTGDVIAARHPGGSCPRCGAEMRYGTVGGRSTWWCSREQAGVLGAVRPGRRRDERVIWPPKATTTSSSRKGPLGRHGSEQAARRHQEPDDHHLAHPRSRLPPRLRPATVGIDWLHDDQARSGAATN
jgi:formamidopyrimidine-DNA glycosylase